MEALDQYLNTLTENQDKEDIKTCCDDEDNIEYNDEWYVCRECGNITSLFKEEAEYKDRPSFIVKTFIQMSYKSSKLVRLHRWLNYSYYEVRNNKLTNFIDDLNIEDREVKNASKVIFLKEFNKVRIRAKVKMGLVCYAIYKAHLIFKKEIEITDLFNMLDITEKHYNSAVKKLEEDRLFYPKNIEKYLELSDNKINKNNLIRSYNEFLSNNTGFNGKTILLSLIYYYLSEEDRKTFFNKYKISKSSVNNVMKLINPELVFN